MATPRKHDPEMELIAEAVSKIPGLDFALVFGSVARGQARPDSDIDVAIAGSGVDLLSVSAAVSHRTGRDAQVVLLRDASIPLLQSIIDDGVLVYDGRAGSAAAWRARVLADLELDRPWYARQRDAWLRRLSERGI